MNQFYQKRHDNLPNLLLYFSVQFHTISVKRCVPFLLLFMLGCRPSPVEQPDLITSPPVEVLQIGVTGSATAVINLITQSDQQSNIQFITANNRTLLFDLQNGRLDAILVHHIPTDLPNWFNPIALDGLVIVVHPDLPIDALSRAEVQAIFNGRLANWSAVGGPDVPIVLISRESGAGTRSLFAQRIMAEQRISINGLVQADDQSLLSTVAATPGAVGYSTMGSSHDAGVILLAIDGRFPTPATTATQAYPLTVPLYFVSAEMAAPTGELRAFLAWLQSENGQEQMGGGYGRVQWQ